MLGLWKVWRPHIFVLHRNSFPISSKWSCDQTPQVNMGVKNGNEKGWAYDLKRRIIWHMSYFCDRSTLPGHQGNKSTYVSLWNLTMCYKCFLWLTNSHILFQPLFLKLWEIKKMYFLPLLIHCRFSFWRGLPPSPAATYTDKPAAAAKKWKGVRRVNVDPKTIHWNVNIWFAVKWDSKISLSLHCPSLPLSERFSNLGTL